MKLAESPFLWLGDAVKYNEDNLNAGAALPQLPVWSLRQLTDEECSGQCYDSRPKQGRAEEHEISSCLISGN